MRIPRDTSIGVVIDIQERLFPHIWRHDEIAERTSIFIRGLQILQVPLIVTQQYTKGLGETISEISELFSNFEHVEKTAFSCCDDKGFMEHLDRYNPTHMIIAGIETHVCILQTGLDALAKGITPVILQDCVSSRRENDREVALSRLQSEGAVISTSESILFELCRYSGTPEFKEISRLVK